MMKAFSTKQPVYGMPSAYVTYEPPTVSDGHFHGAASTLSAAGAGKFNHRSRLRSPELDLDGKRMGGRGKSNVVQKSVDRLENWLGGTRRRPRTPLGGDSVKRLAPLPPPPTTLDYSSSSISTECQSSRSGQSATSSSLTSTSSSSLDDGSPSIFTPFTYIRPGNQSTTDPSTYRNPRAVAASNGSTIGEGHCPSSFSISSSTATSSGSSSSESHKNTSLPSTSQHIGGGRINRDCQLQASTSTSSASSAGQTKPPSSSSNKPSHKSSNMMTAQTAPISRKKIISQSQESGLNEADSMAQQGGQPPEEDDDVWHDKESLFRHHLREVLEKWNSIDDEIWGKIICMEKNRRVAKAYARVPVLTINGSQDGFDGYRIGLSGFDNPKRHPDTHRVKQEIGQGIKLKMDNDGNILIKRVSSSPVFVCNTTGDLSEDHCFSSEVIKAHGQLEADKPIKVFDMKRFTLNIAKEMRGSYPDRRKLELQCFTNIVFVEKMDSGCSHLDIGCWVMLINIVALDMLKNKLPSQVCNSAGSSSQRHLDNGHGAQQRFLSTPRDEHYPRLVHQQHDQHSMADLSMLEATEYGNEEFDDRASVSTYNFVPAYRGGMVQSDYGDLHLLTQQQQRRDVYRTSLDQQHHQYPQDTGYYGLDNYGGGGAFASGSPLALSHHALTEPNFRLRDHMGISGRHFTAPSLARFAGGGAQGQSRHSRSYDSGLESDLTSSSDETDNYNRWTSYQRLHVLPRQMQMQQQQHHRLPAEWE